MKKYTFDVVYQASCSLTTEVPNEITSIEEARKWVKAHWDKMPIPNNADYIPNSDIPDFDLGYDGDELEES